MDDILMSSVYVVMKRWGQVGCGRSTVKRLKRKGERMAPWGTPFLMSTVRDFWPLRATLAELWDRKLASYFLRQPFPSESMIFWMRPCFRHGVECLVYV